MAQAKTNQKKKTNNGANVGYEAERMDQNEKIFMNDAAFQKLVTGWLASEAYKRLRGEGESWTSYQKPPKGKSK